MRGSSLGHFSVSKRGSRVVDFLHVVVISFALVNNFLESNPEVVEMYLLRFDLVLLHDVWVLNLS